MASGIRDIHLSRNTLLAMVTVVGIAAVGLVVYFLVAAGGDEREKDQPEEQTLERPSRPALRQPGENARNTEEAETYPSPGAAQTRTVTEAARAFTDAWLRTGREKAVWLEGIEPYGTEAFNRQRELNNPDDVPAISREGEPSETEAGFGYSTVTVPLDSGTLTLDFRYLEPEWLITSYSFELRAP